MILGLYLAVTMRSVKFWTSIAAASLLSACVFKIHSPYAPESGEASAHTRSFAPDPVFDYSRQASAVTIRVLDGEETETHRVKRLSFPSIGENGQQGGLVTATYFQSKLPGPKKLVIVLPIWGSYTYPSDVIATGLRDHGRGQTNVLNVRGKTHIFDWEGLVKTPGKDAFLGMWERMASRVGTQIIDLRRLIDWAETQPEIDSKRIGVIGFSHGGIFAALLTLQEPRLAATALIMGAAHPNIVIATCEVSGLQKVQESVKTRFGWSSEDYADALEPIFRPYDPASYPGRADPSRVLVIDSYFDTCVPEAAREALWEVMGKPGRISIFESHKGGFLALTPLAGNWMRGRIYEFFDRALENPRQPVPRADCRARATAGNKSTQKVGHRPSEKSDVRFCSPRKTN